MVRKPPDMPGWVAATILGGLAVMLVLLFFFGN
jgi:hypothetical protein